MVLLLSVNFIKIKVNFGSQKWREWNQNTTCSIASTAPSSLCLKFLMVQKFSKNQFPCRNLSNRTCDTETSLLWDRFHHWLMLWCALSYWMVLLWLFSHTHLWSEQSDSFSTFTFTVFLATGYKRQDPFSKPFRSLDGRELCFLVCGFVAGCSSVLWLAFFFFFFAWSWMIMQFAPVYTWMDFSYHIFVFVCD